MSRVHSELCALKLERYSGRFDDEGYDDWEWILGMEVWSFKQLVKDVGMKLGHASKLRSRLGLPPLDQDEA